MLHSIWVMRPRLFTHWCIIVALAIWQLTFKASADEFQYIVYRIDERATESVTQQGSFASLKETLKEGEWIQFREDREEFKLKVIGFNANSASPVDDSVILNAQPGFSAEIKEFSARDFGKYKVDVFSVDPGKRVVELSLTRRPRQTTPEEEAISKPRKLIRRRQSSVSLPYRGVRRTMRVGDVLSLPDMELKVFRIFRNRPRDPNDDSAEIMIRTSINSYSVFLEEFRSEFVSVSRGFYEVYMTEIIPSNTTRGEGQVRLEIIYYP